MPLSNTFSTLFRVFKNLESFGADGYRLWRDKLSKKDSIKSYHLKGLMYPLYLRTNTSDFSTFFQIFIDKQYEYEPKSMPKTIIDCGANIGLASVYFANKYPKAKIIAVEPEGSNFEILLKNTKEYKNIVCLQKGIWNKETNLEIHDTGEGKWSFVTKEVNHVNEHTIPAISINDIALQNNFDTLDIVKIDIEGSEVDVFSANYNEWLNRSKMIIIELHDRMRNNTSKVFFHAIQSRNYLLEVKGENIFCEFI